MEGTLVVPPDRGTIIGRALWKPRYVVVGPANREHLQDASYSQVMTTNRIKEMRGPSSKPQSLPPSPSGGMFLSIYKSKDDWEPIQQHSVSSITDCQVQMLAHRKQGPTLPTLIINISPDPATDKLRKRRSSRTAGLTTTKETAPTTLWFRLGADDSHKLGDWMRHIQSLIPPNTSDRQPMSPITPSSPTFINPFASRSRDASDFYHRPPSANPNPRAPLQHKSSSHTHSSHERDRPITYSETPSLRSKRSDLSSQTSSMNPSHMAFNIPGQHYTTVLPTDLPSPATTVGEYQGEFIEGWTSAQGRSSTLSSPVRGRDSMSSQAPVPPLQPLDSSSPPGPRETILDRAFQLRCIPGSENEVPGEEKLTSLARFDALMREADERRKQREFLEGRSAPVTGPAEQTATEGLKSAWDLDEDSDEVDDDGGEPASDEDDEAHERDLEGDDDVAMPSTAQRALEYISSRRRQGGPRSPASSDAETLMALNSGFTSQLRPHTGYPSVRPGFAQRTHSQPQLAAAHRAASQPLSPLGKDSENRNPTTSANAPRRSATEKRHSSSSAKRLSFNEFTKRLSSTSSLLLVPTTTTSSRGSSDVDGQQQHLSVSSKATLSPRAAHASPLSDKDREAWEKKCGWRGSVGVFGAEGGFL